MSLINNPDIYGCATCANFTKDAKGGKGFCLILHRVMNSGDSCASWEATEGEKAGIDFWTLNIKKDENT